jgi:hypothetical protein
MKENDFFEDLENFDEFEDAPDSDEIKDFANALTIELTNIRNRTAVLTKNNMIALLGVQTFDQGGTICRVDPREAKPAIQIYDNPSEALEWFKKSLRTSKKNGWQIAYDGLPLHG